MYRFINITTLVLLLGTSLLTSNVSADTKVEFIRQDSVMTTDVVSTPELRRTKDRFLDIRDNPYSKAKVLNHGDAVEPTGLVFRPDASVVADDGSVLHLNKEHQSIFRWSPMLGIYTQSIPLSATPEAFAYSASNDVIYLSYNNGLITTVDLESGEETEFARVPGEITAITVLDPELFVVTDTGSEYQQYMFDPDGIMLSTATTSFKADEYVWNEALGKLFFVTNDLMSNQLVCQAIDAAGNFSDPVVAENDNVFKAPVITSASSASLVLGTGDIYDASTLDYVTSLEIDISDAAWYQDDRLLTLTELDDSYVIREWTSAGEVSKEINIPTDSAALVTAEQGSVYLVWLDQGMPEVTLWNFGSNDSDNDGVIDSIDAFPFDASESFDNDSDGLGNNQDPDDDNDDIPDVDDADDDNDGINDANDLFPSNSSEWSDHDSDGIGDNADNDDDNDEVLDDDDAFPFDVRESSDNDSDGIGDNADPDDDNDGIKDEDDEFPLVPLEMNDEEGIDSVTITDVDFDATPLLAFGVIASSYEDNKWYTLPAAGAIDGDLATRWGSEFVEDAWLTVDLGVEQLVNRVVLNWETAYGETYEIQVSDDFTNWNTIAKITAGNGEIDNLEFSATTARYVRMVGKKRGTKWGYSLWEFRIFEPE